MRPIPMLGLLAALLAALPAAGPAAAQPAEAGPTLAAVRARGLLLCGSNPGLPGFAQADAQGVVQGLDADTCRAVAIATLGEAGRVRFLPGSAPETLAALREGRVDLAARNLTQTMGRDVLLGLAPAGITYYDGQGFLVPCAAGIAEARQLDGRRICLMVGSSHEPGLADAARRLGIQVTPVPQPSFAALRDAYAGGGCAAVTTDSSALIALRETGTASPAAHEILPELVTREPLGPLVRDGDPQWRSIVFWTVNALVEAEALGITAANAAARRADPSLRVRRFLGAAPGLGAPLGLADDWAFQVVSRLGNYGEIFERHLGEGSGLRVERGLNALWNRGGLLYPIPMR